MARKIIQFFRLITHFTLFLSIIGTGILLYIVGSQPQIVSGIVDYAQQDVAVKGKVIHTELPTTEEKQQVEVTYTNVENFGSFEELRKSARSTKGEILRGFVAMPATPSTKQIYLPIYEGVSKHVLSIGAGVGAENRSMGKGVFPVFAHNMGNGTSWNPSYFSTLQTANNSVVNMPIYVSDGKSIYTYQIKSLDRYVPNDKGEILDEQPDMTPRLLLITCQEDTQFWNTYYRTGRTYAPYRIVLFADLIQSVSFKEADKNIKSLFPDLYNQTTVAQNQTHTTQEQGTVTQEQKEADKTEKRTIAIPKVKIEQSQWILLINQYGYYYLAGWFLTLLIIELIFWLLIRRMKQKEEAQVCRLRKVR